MSCMLGPWVIKSLHARPYKGKSLHGCTANSKVFSTGHAFTKKPSYLPNYSSQHSWLYYCLNEILEVARHSLINHAYSQLHLKFHMMTSQTQHVPGSIHISFYFKYFSSKVGGRFLFSRENFTTGYTPKTTLRSKQTIYSLFVFLPTCLLVMDGVPLFLPCQRKHNLFTNAQAIAMEMNMR